MLNHSEFIILIKSSILAPMGDLATYQDKYVIRHTIIMRLQWKSNMRFNIVVKAEYIKSQNNTLRLIITQIQVKKEL